MNTQTQSMGQYNWDKIIAWFFGVGAGFIKLLDGGFKDPEYWLTTGKATFSAILIAAGAVIGRRLAIHFLNTVIKPIYNKLFKRKK